MPHHPINDESRNQNRGSGFLIAAYGVIPDRESAFYDRFTSPQVALDVFVPLFDPVSLDHVKTKVNGISLSQPKGPNLLGPPLHPINNLLSKT